MGELAMATTVAVTGAAGLLGRHAVTALEAGGYRVLSIDLPGRGAGREADLAQPEEAQAALRGADAVFHAAAIPRPTGSSAKSVFETNMLTTFAVLDAAERLGIRRLVYASSFSVLGLPFAASPVRIETLPIDEGHPPAPQDVYALTKWLGEEMVEAWTRRTGARAMSLRMPWLQSPGTFWTEVGPRRETPEGALDLWAYLDLRDAGRAVALALAATEKERGHDRLFVAAADSYSETPSADLAALHWPDAALRAPLEGNTSLISSARAAAVLGFVPHHGWREYPRRDERP